MRYLALGDSISIDYYTGVEGGGTASQFARTIGAAGADFQNLTRDGNTTYGVDLNQGIRKTGRHHGFILSDLERLFHRHGIRSREPRLVQVIEPNLPGATAIAAHWHRLFTGQEG